MKDYDPVGPSKQYPQRKLRDVYYPPEIRDESKAQERPKILAALNPDPFGEDFIAMLKDIGGLKR